MGEASRVDSITASFDTAGPCDRCGKKVKRTKSFTAATMAGVQEQADAWAKNVLLVCASCRRKTTF